MEACSSRRHPSNSVLLPRKHLRCAPVDRRLNPDVTASILVLTYSMDELVDPAVTIKAIGHQLLSQNNKSNALLSSDIEKRENL